MAMNGTITTWFKDKGFGFIKDENGENRYFHVIKVANPDLIKKDAAVTFEPTTNNKGLSAYAVKVIPESKYIYIAGERLKLTSIKSYVVDESEYLLFDADKMSYEEILHQLSLRADEPDKLAIYTREIRILCCHIPVS